VTDLTTTSTEQRARGPNLLLVGIPDDVILTEPELKDAWLTTSRTLSRYQKQGLASFLHGGKRNYRAGSAREFMRARERRPNQRGRGRR
jgi:hypothetical protein